MRGIRLRTLVVSGLHLLRRAALRRIDSGGETRPGVFWAAAVGGVDPGGCGATYWVRAGGRRLPWLEGSISMSKYVLAFRGQPGRTPAPEEEQAWGAWFGQIGSAIIDRGNRVGATRTLPAARRGEPGSAVLTGYVVIDAADLDAAAKLAADCPGLADSVDVEVAEVVES